MSRWILPILVMVSCTAQALSIEDFVQSFAHDSLLTQADKAGEISDQVFNSWPGPEYVSSIQKMGALWQTQPEAAYYLLNTVQTTWISRYADPQKLHATDVRSHLLFYLSAWDVIHAASYLKEEIRLNLSIFAPTPKDLPPSPYEILAGMASSQTHLDEVLHHNMNQAITAIAGGTAMAVGMRTLEDVSSVVAKQSFTYGRVVKQALIVGVAAAAVAGLTEGALSAARDSTLWARVHSDTERLMANKEQVPRAVLFDDLFTATQELGYFYSYDLYRKESGQDAINATSNPHCIAAINAYFSGNYDAHVWAQSYIDETVCHDAVAVRIAAIEFLTLYFPQDADARSVTTQLRAKAKISYMSYRESQALENNEPRCEVDVLNGLMIKCIDPKTGNPTL